MFSHCDHVNALVHYLTKTELLDGEVFTTLREAQILIERWRRHYNTVRPHSALGYRPPAPEEHHANRPETDHALSFKQDHPMGALHLACDVVHLPVRAAAGHRRGTVDL